MCGNRVKRVGMRVRRRLSMWSLRMRSRRMGRRVGSELVDLHLEVRRMPTILQNHYVLAVHNVRDSARFYVEALGFKITAEPKGWIFVAKDNCVIMLGECPGDLQPSELGSHSYFAYLRVDDAAAYHADLISKGVRNVGKISDQPWGMREFPLASPDGHRIMIGQKIVE